MWILMTKINTMIGRGLIALIKAYQVLLSPFIGGQCRFYPTCSRYAEGCINNHGPLKGSVLALKRLSKCHPFHPGGIDCVPEHRET